MLLSVLSSAYNLSSEVIPAQVGNSNPLNDPRIHTGLARLCELGIAVILIPCGSDVGQVVRFKDTQQIWP